MPSLFNVVKLVNGRLVQFDDFSNTIDPVQPSPESEPSEPIPSNPDPEPQVNPLGLPPYTIRVKYEPDTKPGTDNEYGKLSGATVTQVSGTDDTWDVTYQNTDWSSLFYEEHDLLEILGANTSDVTVMGGDDDYGIRGCFEECTSLTTVALFDTSKVTTMERMFYRDFSLTELPLFDMSKVTTIANMCRHCVELQSVPLFTHTDNIVSSINAFVDCIAVRSGAVELYQQLSSNENIDYRNTFMDCGKDTESGLAELEQIPIGWGGRYEENPNPNPSSSDDGSAG